MKSSKDNKTAAIVLCAGSGMRAGLGYNKILYDLGGAAVAERSVRAFARLDCVAVVYAENDGEILKNMLSGIQNVRFVLGGATRGESVKNGLNALDGDTQTVLIHDGARPFVTRSVIDACAESARTHGSGVAAIPSLDSVRIKYGNKTQAVARDEVYKIQTPQAFNYRDILDAYNTCSELYTDDAQVYEQAGHTVTLVAGSEENIKLTEPSQFFAGNRGMRAGIGYDVHQLVSGRPLILGGVTVPHDKGLLGHSDADALCHAVTDALLSAAGLGDIGTQFPDCDPKYKDANSVKLLEKAYELTNGATVLSVSAVIIAQKPKLKAYLPKMREIISAALNLPADDIGLSATTTEGLGVVGSGQGIAAAAVVLIKKA